jgi:hypothetical protein
MSGYARSPSFLRAVVGAISDVRTVNPDVIYGACSAWLVILLPVVMCNILQCVILFWAMMVLCTFLKTR